MKHIIQSIVASFIISIFILSCGTENDNNYRNDIYKAIVSNQNVINYGILQHYIPVMDSALNTLDKYIVESIENYSDYIKTYGIYKDTVGIDSSFFDKNRIICFFIVIIGGAIDSYTYEIKDDSLLLNCKVKLYPEKQNGFLVPKELTPYIITFGNTK